MKQTKKNIEDLFNLKSEKIPDVTDILKSVNPNKNKKAPKKSILDELATYQQQVPQVLGNNQMINNQIVIPNTLEQDYIDKTINNIVDIQQKESEYQQRKQQAQQRKQQAQQAKQIISEENYSDKNQETKQQLQYIKNEKLPENIDYIETEEEINSAFENIPNSNNMDIIDVDIKAIPVKKDKSGYFKTKVTIKKENIPQQIIEISSLIKKQTHGLISPRVCDLRVISNTNKTQLKSAKLKLSSATVVFKPDFQKLKVNKGTRIMLSIPDNYSSTGNILVYIQESRDKSIIELVKNDFATIDEFNKFIIDTISNYYTVGYKVSLTSMESHGKNNPLMKIVDTISKTNEFKIKPNKDNDNHIISIYFNSKESKNQWLTVEVTETDIQGMYDIVCLNNIDKSWEYKAIAKPISLNQLNLNLYDILIKLYNYDWELKLGIKSDDDKFFYLYGKLNHNKLKKAMIQIHDLSESNKEIGLKIAETLSKLDTSKKINPDYDAESIIGKTNFIDYFILTFLAYPVKTERKGSDYITKPEYIEKYGIKNGDDYNNRKRIKTIDKETGEQRSYFGRIYMFQLEYSIKGQKNIYRDIEFKSVLDETEFISDTPKIVQSKY
jgi:hypothetical protein